MGAPRQNPQAALKFLRDFYGEGKRTLTAVPLKRYNLPTSTFGPGQEDEVADWLRAHGRDNVYFSVNEPSGRPSKKTSKTDIERVRWLHVDVDARAGEDPQAEFNRILGLMKKPPEGVPAPTCVIFSGGGYQAFWRLEEPIEIGGSEERAEQAERYNRQLELLFGADPCHNVDRIMRLPGTVNWPTEKKIRRGRTPQTAKVVDWDGTRVYPLSRFTPAPEKQDGQMFGAGKVKVSGNIRRLGSLDELPKGVGAQCRVIIAQGVDPDEPNRFESRSHALFYVVCELVRAGLDDDTIYSIITDRVFGISASVLDKGSNAKRYAVRQIEQAREKAIDPWLMRLNSEYAVIGNHGGKCRILTEKEDVIGGTRRSRVNFLSFQDFINFHRNKMVELGTDKKGEKMYMPAGNWWINHEHRREYRTVVFAPGHEIPDAYNLWKGFAFDSRPGDCSIYMQHVRDNICGGDEEVLEYLLGWMATAVQRPAQPGHTAVVLRGRQGTGKGMFAKNFGAVFGRHFLHVRDSNHLFGQFNAHLRDCLVLFADEAFWAGVSKHESLLKSLITEETIMCEAKGVDAEPAQNFIHLIMASNAEWVVPAGGDDRRFLVLDVLENNMQDARYFGEMMRQLRGGGYEALLHQLMTRDLSGYDVRKIPQTDALKDQKIRSLSDEEEWWYAKLRDGRVLGEDDGWPEEVHVTALCHDFTEYCKLWGATARSNSTKLGRFMSRVCPSGHQLRGQLSGRHMVMQQDGVKREVNRPHVYKLPPLDASRRRWDELFGGPYDWEDPK